MRNRIVQFLSSEGLSPAKFADEIGVQRSGISHIVTGRNNPSFDVIQKILTRYKTLNAEWLIMGTGTMYKNNLPVSQPSVSEKITTHHKAEPNLFDSKPVNNILNFSETTVNTNIEPNLNAQLNITAETKIEKIVIFYSDKTFSEYTPK